MPKPRVIVVGAGMGGLAATLELASKGCSVHLVEAGETIGGKLHQVIFPEHAGIDCGPTVFTMRWIFEGLFRDLGIDLNEHLKLRPLDLLARHAWPGSPRLDLFADENRTTEAIAAFSSRSEAMRYRKFCETARRTFETLDKTYMQDERPNVAQLMYRIAKNQTGGLASIHPFRSLWDELGAHFKDPRLTQLFGRYATYCGSSPFEAPGTLILIAHAEKRGVWAVDGGMVRIAETFAALAEAAGATITTRQPVTQLLKTGNRTAGVKLANGEELTADAVVFNGDINALASGLVSGARDQMAKSEIRRGERSQSAITWSLVGTSQGFELAPHTVCFSNDYAAEFDDVFKRGRFPQKPTVYINAPDRYADASPSGAERLFVLINAPPNGDLQKYGEDIRAAAREAAWSTLRDCGIDMSPSDGLISITTPEEFAQRFPGTGGALYGRASHGWKASFARQGARSAIPGLYLAGGSVHPGAGIPMALISGRLAAAAVLKDAGIALRRRGR